MKETYLFELGRDPKLSVIEIESYLQKKELKFEILETGKNIVVIKTENLDAKETTKQLGGTIKIAKVISTSGKIEDIEQNLNQQELYMGEENKTYYSVNAYNTDIDDYVLEYLKDYFKRIKVKAILKKDIEPSRLAKKELETEILDIVIYKNYIGKTVATTNPKEIKERDLGRPNVDYMKTISIRLAKILINLSQVKEKETLVDPFCGSGTVLQEAIIKGINAIGLDSDSNSIKQSKDNLEWVKQHYEAKGQYQLIKLDSRKMASVIKEADAIVTEPYMGPYIKKLPTMTEARELTLELTDLYTTVINQAARMLHTEKRIVMIVPRIRTRENSKVLIDFKSIIENAGFRSVYEPILYAYKESKLHREIWVLEKS